MKFNKKLKDKLKNKMPKVHKETLAHKIMMTMLSAIATAVVAGFLGYKLNTRLPELYYKYSPTVTPVSIAGIAQAYRLETVILNLGKGPASDLVIRYAFNQNIVYYDYNYSEELNGKLPSSNVKGGVGCKELVLMPKRILPQEEIQAKFIFKNPKVKVFIKVFAKEGMARNYNEWKERGSKNSAKFWKQVSLLGQNIFYNLTKQYNYQSK